MSGEASSELKPGLGARRARAAKLIGELNAAQSVLAARQQEAQSLIEETDLASIGDPMEAALLADLTESIQSEDGGSFNRRMIGNMQETLTPGESYCIISTEAPYHIVYGATLAEDYLQPSFARPNDGIGKAFSVGKTKAVEESEASVQVMIDYYETSNQEERDASPRGTLVASGGESSSRFEPTRGKISPDDHIKAIREFFGSESFTTEGLDTPEAAAVSQDRGSMLVTDTEQLPGLLTNTLESVAEIDEIPEPPAVTHSMIRRTEKPNRIAFHHLENSVDTLKRIGIDTESMRSVVTELPEEIRDQLLENVVEFLVSEEVAFRNSGRRGSCHVEHHYAFSRDKVKALEDYPHLVELFEADAIKEKVFGQVGSYEFKNRDIDPEGRIGTPSGIFINT